MLHFTLKHAPVHGRLADAVETRVKCDGSLRAEDWKATVEKVVVDAVQPEILKNQILQDIGRRTLKVHQSPTALVEEIRVLCLFIGVFRAQRLLWSFCAHGDQSPAAVRDARAAQGVPGSASDYQEIANRMAADS